VSSIKDRQRAAARARLEKEMAERSAAARKRRQRQATLGAALALVVVVAGTVWLVTSLGGDDDKKTDAAGAPAAGTTSCVWNKDASGNPKLKDVGTPPASVPNVGSELLTIDTNLGPIEATLDLAKVPCTAASFAHLASKNFYNNSKCHRLVTEGLKVLQCGDPSATGKGWRESDGSGGPSYKYAEENLPVGKTPPYPKGVIAMAKTQEPNSTGSQFFIVYADTELDPAYTVLGTISKGLDIVEKVAKAGHDDAFKEQAGGGHPKLETVIKSMKVAKV
jgi:peptidyl-prolyl cis-trans isomerase B (cyclophilin B)